MNALREDELSVGQLSERLQLRQSNLSQHLSVLRKVGAVTYRKEGQTVFYAISSPKIIQAYDLISEVVMERNRMNMKLLSAITV